MTTTTKHKVKHVMITGGAGYVGSRLVPQLLRSGYKVTVLDLYLFGDDVLTEARKLPGLREVKGDMRNRDTVREALSGCDAVIHLACISNDPSFELDPSLGRSINYDCFPMLLEETKRAGVKRFIYASSSSVYGVKEVSNVTEDLPLEPLTDYSKYKALCEDLLRASSGFTYLIIRPATVCGYSPRLRLDLTVNILTNHAVNKGEITVLGGAQMRPNIHIQDMCDLYERALELEDGLIHGKIYNCGYENHRVSEIAEMVRSIVGSHVKVVTKPTNDNRSYHISSAKIAKELGFAPKHTIRDAVQELVDAFSAGKVPDSFELSRYYNIKTMQEKRFT